MLAINLTTFRNIFGESVPHMPVTVQLFFSLYWLNDINYTLQMMEDNSCIVLCMAGYTWNTMFGSKHRIFRGTQTNESILREVREKWKRNLKPYMN